MYGVYLHVLADALGSVAVIVSSILIKYFGLYIADSICCFGISILILLAAIPFII
jgi:zinc transporter 5/7